MADRLELVCDCGRPFTLNARSLRRAHRQGRRPVCGSCKPLGGAGDSEALQRWWIESSGLSFDELREIAYLLWPALRPEMAQGSRQAA
jgi:hypothetical protein